MSTGTEPITRLDDSQAVLSLYHLLDPVVLANPYPLFHRLRNQSPVHWDPFLHAWVVTRYDDVLEVLHTFTAARTPSPEQLHSMGLGRMSPVAQLMVQLMLFMDGSSHARLRGLASKAFTPARVEKLRGHIRDVVDQLLRNVEAQGSMDVVRDLGEPLPAIITTEMLGVPVEDRFRLKKWSANLAEMLGNFQHNPDHAELMLNTVDQISAYFREIVRQIKDHPREGLISSMLSAEIDGDRLTEDEVIANSIVTMLGGMETTTTLIASGVLTLLRYPDQLAKLESNLTLIPSAVEEMLRFESPSQITARIAPRDLELGGQQIRKGQAVMAVMAAANRDPERFPNPDLFDITRPDNRHLAFGYAAHFCFGAPLARAEGQIAFENLLQRFTNLRLMPQELQWRSNLGLRSLNSLKIEFERRGKSLQAPEAVAPNIVSPGTCPHMKAVPPVPTYQRCIHDLFKDQAERTPNAIAAVHGENQLTYRELNERANQLAHLLLEKGVTTDKPVAVCVRRSLALPVSLLGVLKAGGACVPLDPSYPATRVSYIQKDSQAPVLITEPGLLEGHPDSNCEVVPLTEDFSAIETYSRSDLHPASKASDVAYLIYTSGSTGEPRGVMLEHRGLANHHLAAIELYGLTPSDRVLQFSALGFDIAVEEMLPTWASGGTVVFRTADMPLTAKEFMRWIEKQGITVLDLPTAYWHEIVRELAETGERLSSALRMVIVGGEKASSSAYAAWLKIGGDRVRWINTYGPTETSIIATAYEPDPSQPFPENLPIGKEIQNYALRVVGSDLNPVPVGTPGELIIGGPGVARGYLRRPELTDQKFIPGSKVQMDCERAYRTGDLVRMLEDGNIEFVGRTDFQVKIRGFRVELGEIESALEKHASVKAAVVTAIDNGIGKTLCAYIVPTGKAPNSGDLRRFLQTSLPEYMVPASYTFLESLPLTPNGKVDRRGLPAPAAAEQSSTSEFVAPRDDFEARMQKIWQQVLAQKRIGIYDNYFELGGHSLIAVRLMQRIEKEFGKNILITKLLEAPTIATLTQLVRDDAPSDLWPSIVPLQPNGSKDPLFFVHGLFGSVLRFRDFAAALAPDQPMYGIQAQGLDGVLPPLSTVQEMVDLYYGQLRKFRPHGPYHLGGYSFGGLVALEIARRLIEDGESVGVLALVDTYFSGTESAGLLQRFSSLPLSGKVAYTLRRMERFRRGLRTMIRVAKLPPAIKHVREAAAQAEHKYQPQFYPGTITLFRAAEKGLRGLDNPDGGWEKHARGFEVCEIEGDHGSILDQPNVHVLATHIRTRIEQLRNQ